MADALNLLLQVRGLKLGMLPTKGRCLFAARRFLPGEAVLDQSPYASALNSTGKRCDGCYKEDCKLQECSLCKSVWYCSKACQEQEQVIHKYECKCLSMLMAEKGRELTPSLRLMLRLLIRKCLEKEMADSVNPFDAYELVELLPTHFEETSEQQLILYAQMANLLRITYNYGELGNVDIKEITHNFCRFACNAHTITDAELRPLGIGLYPVISIINHSCQPNCILLFEGKKAYVRAIQEISEGMEVTLSYVDLGDNTLTRLQNLKLQYFFNCVCPRCLPKATSDKMLDNDHMEGFLCPIPKCKGLLITNQEYSEKMLCKTCGKETDKSKVLDKLKSFDCYLDDGLRHLSIGNLGRAKQAFEKLDQVQTSLLQKSSLHRIKTYDNLLKICMAMEDWVSALVYCHKAIKVYERVYLPNHPLLGLQHYTCGKLEW
ncbi:hypothetical protein KP509_09G063100 [Ceratopteris richardii]|nr:hypothetical protein KP509_09G063100 [Ceratopteris richardii]